MNIHSTLIEVNSQLVPLIQLRVQPKGFWIQLWSLLANDWQVTDTSDSITSQYTCHGVSAALPMAPTHSLVKHEQQLYLSYLLHSKFATFSCIHDAIRVYYKCILCRLGPF